MNLRERRVRKYVQEMCREATESQRGAVYDAGPRTGLRRGDAELARDLTPDSHCMLVLEDYDEPRVVVVGINAPCAWSCFVTGIRGLLMGGLVEASDEMFAALEVMRADVSQDAGGAVLQDAREVILAPLTDDEVRHTREQFGGTPIPDDIERRLQSRSVT